MSDDFQYRKGRNPVDARIDENDVSGTDYGDGEGVEATCLKCGHTEAALGTGEGSRLAALAKLHANCPRGENNFYREC